MKTVRLTESDLTRIVKRVMLESKKEYVKKAYISEQVALLSIPPANILFGAGDTPQQIKLKGVDPKTQQTLVLKYNIQGRYGVGFDVNLRNIKRGPNGNLTAEVQPDSWAIKKTMQGLVPKEHQTSDGWLYIDIPKEKINTAISQLRQNKGTAATIDAGQGVSISLTLAS